MAQEVGNNFMRKLVFISYITDRILDIILAKSNAIAVILLEHCIEMHCIKTKVRDGELQIIFLLAT